MRLSLILTDVPLPWIATRFLALIFWRRCDVVTSVRLLLTLPIRLLCESELVHSGTFRWLTKFVIP